MTISVKKEKEKADSNYPILKYQNLNWLHRITVFDVKRQTTTAQK